MGLSHNLPLQLMPETDILNKNPDLENRLILYHEEEEREATVPPIWPWRASQTLRTLSAHHGEKIRRVK